MRTNADGVDLVHIRRHLALTPTERVQRPLVTVEDLRRFERRVRRG